MNATAIPARELICQLLDAAAADGDEAHAVGDVEGLALGVVVPGGPVPHLVIGQPRLPFGPLETFFDPVRRLGHPGQLLERGLRGGIR